VPSSVSKRYSFSIRTQGSSGATGQLVATPRQLLLRLEQLEPGGKPLSRVPVLCSVIVMHLQINGVTRNHRLHVTDSIRNHDCQSN